MSRRNWEKCNRASTLRIKGFEASDGSSAWPPLWPSFPRRRTQPQKSKRDLRAEAERANAEWLLQKQQTPTSQ